MRFKIYDKTAEKLTSDGVSNNFTTDPLSKLLLTCKKDNAGNYYRKLFTNQGFATCRLECSFYNSSLQTIRVY